MLYALNLSFRLGRFGLLFFGLFFFVLLLFGLLLFFVLDFLRGYRVQVDGCGLLACVCWLLRRCLQLYHVRFLISLTFFWYFRFIGVGLGLAGTAGCRLSCRGARIRLLLRFLSRGSWWSFFTIFGFLFLLRLLFRLNWLPFLVWLRLRLLRLLLDGLFLRRRRRRLSLMDRCWLTFLGKCVSISIRVIHASTGCPASRGPSRVRTMLLGVIDTRGLSATTCRSSSFNLLLCWRLLGFVGFLRGGTRGSLWRLRGVFG